MHTELSQNFQVQRGITGIPQWTITSFILQSSQIMILNSTKFGGNRTKDVEVGPDRQTDSYIPPQTMFAGGINMNGYDFRIEENF